MAAEALCGELSALQIFTQNNSMLKFKMYLTGALIGSVLGGLFVLFQGTWWESEGLVTIGHVGMAEKNWQLIEDAQVSIERIKTNSFKDSAYLRLNSDSEVAEIRRGSFSIVAIPVRALYPDTLIIRVSGQSEAGTEAITQAIIDELIAKHNQIYEEIVKSTQDDLSGIRERLKRTRSKIDSCKMCAEDTVSRYYTELGLLSDYEFRLSNSISGKTIQRTKAVERVSASRRQLIAPWKAVLIGLLFGVGVAIAAANYRNKSQSGSVVV